jgi:DNA-binding beta-propeller fold protein YncE
MMVVEMRTIRFIIISWLAALAIVTAQPPVPQVTIKVEGLACPFCAYGMEKHLKRLDAVETVDISLKAGEAIVRLKPGQTVTEEQLRAAIRAGGFTAKEIRFTEAVSPKPPARPNRFVGIALLPDGTVLVSDAGRGQIQQRDADLRVRKTFGELQRPMHITTDAAGNVYVPEYLADRVQKFSPDGKRLLAFGQAGQAAGEFNAPAGVAVDAHGFIYVADFYNHRVQKFDAHGRFVTQWGNDGHGSGELHYPTDVAVDAAGNVWVADAYNHRLQQFTADGKFLAMFGRYGAGKGEFNVAEGIALDAHGRIYVADFENHRVQVFTPDGKFVTELGKGELRYPTDVAVPADGHVWVVDYGHDRIQILPAIQ